MEGSAQFLIQLAASSLLSALLASAVTWLAKSWITERLKGAIKNEYDQRLEAHKLALKHDYDQKLETIRSQMAIEAERFRSQLSMDATEHAVRFKALHESRVLIVVKLHDLLVESYAKARGLVSPIEFGGEPNKLQKYAEARNTLRQFFAYFESNKIYLPLTLCDQVERVIRETQDVVVSFGVFVESDGDSAYFKGSVEQWDQAWKRMDEDVRTTRSLIEAECRSILGAGDRANA